MQTIKVKAVKGRIARTAPDGEFIPENRFIPVVKTKYIERLLNVHGDIVEQTASEMPKPGKKDHKPKEEPAEPARAD